MDIALLPSRKEVAYSSAESGSLDFDFNIFSPASESHLRSALVTAESTALNDSFSCIIR